MAEIELTSSGIKKIVDQLAAIIRSDAALRNVQGRNAPQAKYFDQPVAPNAITGAVIYSISQAQNNNEIFYSLVLTFDASSGAGRYRIDGANPTDNATFPSGVAIPAGGVVLQILGSDNIKNFRMMAEAGQTLVFARYLFI